MNILLCGCLGRMGRAVAAGAAAAGDTVTAGIDITDGKAEFPIYRHPAEVTEPVNAVIDFSNPASLADVLEFAISRSIPAVIATTGHSPEQKAAIQAAAEKIPVFYSGNMSIGVALLAALTQKAAAVLGDSFDVEILEMHHNQKLDAPSGTALMLADAAKAGLSYTPEYVYDRHERRQKRDPHEIGIASLRGGNVVGEHQVIFAGHDETVTLTHRAQSREIFAVGALRAARFIAGKPAGMYNMTGLLNEV